MPEFEKISNKKSFSKNTLHTIKEAIINRFCCFGLSGVIEDKITPCSLKISTKTSSKDAASPHVSSQISNTRVQADEVFYDCISNLSNEDEKKSLFQNISPKVIIKRIIS